jgi:very-short-patch-repair endonuclease
MRQAPTDSEATLWHSLRARQLGVEFRRQVPVLHFIVDFLAPAARLVVEVDGGYHARRAGADARRDDKLRRAGYRVLRVGADAVSVALPAVLGGIRQALK